MDSVQLSIFCDFDGTVTQCDVVDFLLENLAEPAWKDIEALWEEGLITSRDCMARQIPMIRGGWSAIERVLAHVKLDPDFKAFAAWCHENQFPLVIVSEGLDRVIHHLLDRDGIRVSQVLANHLEEFEPDGGQTAAEQTLHMSLSFPHAHPAGTCPAGLCKCQVLGTYNARTVRVVIGDGASDYCWSAEADFLFAKSKLRQYCLDKKKPHTAFTGFKDILPILQDVAKGRETDPVQTVTPNQETCRGDKRASS